MIQLRPPPSLSNGPRTSAAGIRAAQERFATSAAEVARHGAVAANQLASDAGAATSSALSPPNPGPPGGAQPADLAEAMVDQSVATHELTANVKTLQAFDEMLDELTKLKR